MTISAKKRLATTFASVAILLAGCGVENHVAEVEDDGCTGAAMAAALPEDQIIASKPLKWKSCSDMQVTACYGDSECDGGDDRCVITFHDGGFALQGGATAVAGISQALDHAQMMIVNMTKVNVEMLKGTREQLLQEPELLAIYGGPGVLPVVQQLSTGDTYAVAVPPQGSPARETLHALVGERYALTIECSEEIRDHDHALSIYQPFVSALNLSKLP